MSENTRRHARPRARRLRPLIAALLGAVLAVGGVLVAPMGASAAGPAVLSLELTPINPTTGETVSSTAFGQHNNRLGYRVAYSCSVAECTDAVITLPAFALDPTYGQFRLYDYETWTPPAGGAATIASNAVTGVTVRLGTVAAGTSATFVVQYQRAVDTSAPNAVPAAYFPPGYQIQRSATLASPNATASASATAAPVTWNIAVPSPSVVKSGPARVAPDTPTTYTLAMSSGCFENLGSSRYVATGRTLCAESYQVVDRLPAQAVFVSASDGGSYDAATHTVRWSASGATAAGGWGVAAFSGWTQRYGYNVRTVTVTYPASAFPEGADGVDFSASVTNAVDVTVTYLDDAETTKTASTSFRHDVVRSTPFGRADQTKIGSADQDIQGSRWVNVPPDTTGLVCPPSGRDDWNRACTPGQAVAPFATRTDRFWQVDTYNRGNVPGIATVVDNDLGNSSVRVTRINTSGSATPPTVSYTYSDGVTVRTGTATGATVTAPAGTWFTAATVTSGLLAGPNLLPSGTAGTLFRINYGYDLPVGTPLFTWRNSASATMTYPDNPEIAPITTAANGAVIFRETPKVAAAAPAFNAGFVGTPVVEGGGQVVPGGKVTFGVTGATANIPANRTVSPQYVFIAPIGWNVVPNSASFPAGSVPPGVSFTSKTVTIGGAPRQAVIASWPTGATFGANATWPIMSVAASPTSAVAAGTSSQATVWVSDARNVYDADTTTWGGKVVDGTDVDGDGNTTEAFASASSAVTVSGVARLDVIKEICVVTADGCDWISNPDVVVGVDPDASDIRYRVSLVNAGNTVLSGVVGYDVLPHLADGRGSTFAETLNAVTAQSSNLTLTYSDSTNPCRPEVRSDETGCDPGWTGSANGASAIRAQLTGSLAPGASTRFEFTADVVPGAPADAIACNSVAVDTASTLPAEPRPVCATTQEADLEVTVPDRLPLQAGRPGVVPFTVTNLGGSVTAPASVDIAVPAGIRITSLTPAGWVCEADEVDPDGSVLGPVTLTCDPVTAEGASRMLALDEPSALDLPAVIPDDELVGERTCFPATVSGLMSDPVAANNEDDACFVVAQGETLLGLTKDDARTSVAMGEEFTYSIEVANLLTGEGIENVVVTDELPATLAFVSATAGGAVAGQGDADADGLRPGGTVTWNLASLTAAGVSGDGDGATGAEGSTRTLAVTVRVVQAAEDTDVIVNEVSVTAPDPALPGVTLAASDDDTDDLVRTAAISLDKTADVETVDAVGDAITYAFLVTNTGDVTLDEIAVAETAFTGSGTAPEIVCAEGDLPLAPGATTTCSAEYTVTQADLDRGSVSNTAAASATPPEGVDAPASAPSTAIVTVDAAPALALVKSVVSEPVRAAGDVVEYAFAVTNGGNVSVSDIAITETAFTGTGAAVTPVCDATEPVAPQETVVCTASYTVTQADVNAGRIDNTAVAGAVTTSGDEVTSDPSSAAVVIGAEPRLTVVKSATPTDLVVDQELTYSFVVTNTGNVSLQDVAVREEAFTGSGDLSSVDCGDAEATLDPDEQLICAATYVITQDDVDAGELSNTATATAVAPGGPIASDPSTVELPFERRPDLAIVKSADVAGLTDAGEEIEYRFRVTNTGTVTVSDVEVLEQDFSGTGELSEIACDVDRLLPGQRVDCAATYEVTQEDIDAGVLINTAGATGEAPGADGPVQASPSRLTLPFTGVSALALTKTGTPVDVDGDDRITAADGIHWSFAVTNTGASTLSELAVADPMAGEVVCESDALAPGASADCAATAEYRITAAQAAAGEVVNVATASALGVGAVTVTSAEAQAVVAVGVAAPPAPGGLATTGADSRALVLLGLFAVLIGAGALLAVRDARRPGRRA